MPPTTTSRTICLLVKFSSEWMEDGTLLKRLFSLLGLSLTLTSSTLTKWRSRPKVTWMAPGWLKYPQPLDSFSSQLWPKIRSSGWQGSFGQNWQLWGGSILSTILFRGLLKDKFLLEAFLAIGNQNLELFKVHCLRFFQTWMLVLRRWLKVFLKYGQDSR